MTDTAAPPAPPIVVCAPMGRSGTTFCKFLLESHPDVYAGLLYEDYLLQEAGNLAGYAEQLSDRWSRLKQIPRFSPEKESADSILATLGGSLLDYIGQRPGPDRMVLKTPRFGDLDVGLRLFPGVQFLIMIRDPRSIVSSFMRIQQDWGVNLSFETLASNWAREIRYLTKVLTENQDAVRGGQLILVRYERLAQDTEVELRKILAALNLPIADACLDAARNQPVLGSSYFNRDASRGVRWAPPPRTADFDPIRRWSDWTPERHGRFNQICGALMEKWGYPPVSGGVPVRNRR